MRSDSCFDGLASTFEAELYGTTKGRVRLEVLWTEPPPSRVRACAVSRER